MTMHAQTLRDEAILREAEGWIFLDTCFPEDITFFRRLNGNIEILIDNSEFESGDWWTDSDMSDDDLIGNIEDAELVPFMRIPKRHYATS